MYSELDNADLPESLRNLPQPPKQLYIRSQGDVGLHDFMIRPRVAIVGSRNVTTYGKDTTYRFASELAARGVVIISGLAFGVDAIAHRAALDAGGLTIAVLPCSVHNAYPRSHAPLAQEILAHGGLLVSEYSAGTPALIHHFVARNRIVAGLSDALLITEAAQKSGSLHTARFAMEQGIDVLAIPGNITSPTSEGTNNLIKTGATPATEINDILRTLDLCIVDSTITHRVRGSNADEQNIINLMEQGISDGSELLRRSGLSVEQYNHHLTMLEITAKVRALGANTWALG